MANYHAHLKSISRADGRSATGSIAYRAACKVVDERTGIEFDYTKKKGVEHTQIFFPPGEDDSRPDLHDTSALWNEVEKRETKSNAQVAREFEFSFPHELNAEQRQQMLSVFCQWLTKNHGVVAQGCIHAPHGKDADERNFHAHILFSTRRFEKGQFTEKTREFSKLPYDEKELAKYMAKGGEDYSKRLLGRKNVTELFREAYEVIGNQSLVEAGFEPTLDRRSYADRGIDKEPTLHEGAGRAMSKRGLQSETHDKNQEIIERNKTLAELDKEIIVSSALVDRLDVEYNELLELQNQIQQQYTYEAEQRKKRDEAEQYNPVVAYNIAVRLHNTVYSHGLTNQLNEIVSLSKQQLSSPDNIALLERKASLLNEVALKEEKRTDILALVNEIYKHDLETIQAHSNGRSITYAEIRHCERLNERISRFELIYSLKVPQVKTHENTRNHDDSDNTFTS